MCTQKNLLLLLGDKGLESQRFKYKRTDILSSSSPIPPPQKKIMQPVFCTYGFRFISLFKVETVWSEIFWPKWSTICHKRHTKTWKNGMDMHFISGLMAWKVCGTVYFDKEWQVCLVVHWCLLTSWKHEMVLHKSNSCKEKIILSYEAISNSYGFMVVI